MSTSKKEEEGKSLNENEVGDIEEVGFCQRMLETETIFEAQIGFG